jgi:hypothetical protein
MKPRELDIHLEWANNSYRITILGDEVDCEYFETLIDHLKEQIDQYL